MKNENSVEYFITKTETETKNQEPETKKAIKVRLVVFISGQTRNL